MNLTVNHGGFHYQKDTPVFKDINFSVDSGEILAILGPNGAGKTTMLRCITGMIFQNFSLFQQRTVLQNVMFPLEVRKESRAASAERAHELLRLVSLDDKASRYPSELSGGQQQRVAIARALANEPHYMLCDEATSALDSRTTVQVLDLLARINKEMGVTMVVITHSLAVARRVCNRIAVIDAGHIVEEGFTADVFANPQSQVARELLDWGFEDAKGGDE